MDDTSGAWFSEANFNGVPDGIFDDVIQFLDFPLDDVEENVEGEDWNVNFQSLGPPISDFIAGFSTVHCSGMRNDNVEHPKNIPPSLNGIPEARKRPRSADVNSNRSIVRNENSPDVKYSYVFQSCSPISVLESGSSCSGENPKRSDPKFSIPVKRARTKRPHSTINPWLKISVIPSALNVSNHFDDRLSSETFFAEKMLNLGHRKQKKKKNLSLLSGATEVKELSLREQSATKKCMHCETTKTPQWREGPMGPKTLCNACGVRYRSGRLFPEYRPAASPTFVSSLHSNSHKKVIEMRNNASRKGTLDSVGTLSSPVPAISNRQLSV